MNFAEVEEKTRLFIEHGHVKEAIQYLKTKFKDDRDIDLLTLQLSTYHDVIEKNYADILEPGTADRALRKLKVDILNFLSAKKEYFSFKEKTFGEEANATKDANDLITVFFSVASPFNENQQSMINKLKDHFTAKGIKLQTLINWNEEDPIIPIIEQLKSSAGCLVLALERYYVAEGFEKRGSEQENTLAGNSLTSPWLHIEAAISRSLNIPLLILKDESLKNEGLIHNDKQEWGTIRVQEDRLEDLDKYPIKNFILNWINQVKRYDANKRD
ncbi:MAG: hypothetical protein AAF828_06295 [Bacteroidota bacterium]